MKFDKPSTDAERATRTVLTTEEVDQALIYTWKLPPCQRPLRENPKLFEVAESIKDSADKEGIGIIPGIMTIGILPGDTTRWLIDGNHRRHGFKLSGLERAYVDLRIVYCKNQEEIADEFYKLNSRIVNMKPDDYLRSKEAGSPALIKLRKKCPFIGYDNIRRNATAPTVSASSVLRCWFASGKESPSSSGSGILNILDEISGVDINGAPILDSLIKFMDGVFSAWGKDEEYHRLWGNLNLTMCMWLYRRTVMKQHSHRSTRLSDTQFVKCMMSVSANHRYLDWLVSRQLNDRDRTPAYRKIKEIASQRVEQDTGVRPNFPTAVWSSTSGRKASTDE